MNTNSTKADLRKHALAKRRALDPKDVALRSRVLVNKLIKLIEPGKKTHCFLPLVKDNEPDLRLFIEYAIKAGSEVYTTDPEIREIKYPESELAQKSLKHFEITEDVKFDLIVAPMLGYRGLHRLGFGGGFYDRLLVGQPEAKKIGVCFKEFELKNLPIESHDIELDKIIII